MTPCIVLPLAATALVLPRRAVLVQSGGAALTLLARPVAAPAEEPPPLTQPLIVGADGQTLDPSASSETSFQIIRRGGASVRALAGWNFGADGVTAPVLGRTAQAVTFSANATPLGTISDLGKPEQVPIVRALSLDADLDRADLVAASRRVDEQGAEVTPGSEPEWPRPDPDGRRRRHRVL